MAFIDAENATKADMATRASPNGNGDADRDEKHNESRDEEAWVNCAADGVEEKKHRETADERAQCNHPLVAESLLEAR